MRAKALLISLLAASALAGPTGQRESCALHCNYEAVFSYQQGKSYVYEYEATTSTALLNTLDETSDIKVTATAHIDVISPCEYSLRLTNANLEGSSHSQEFTEAITKSPLRFAFQDGRVESVCSDVSEPAWVTNFKRGVLSTFQSTVHKPGKHDIHETDIHGTCITHYSSRVEGDVMTVDKVKDIRSCSHHSDLNSYLAASAYVSDSPIQNLPIFNSDNKCHQTIEAGIINTAECHETHKFRPFSSMEGGAQTTVKTTLVLMSHDQQAAVLPSYEFMRKTPTFEKTNPASAQAELEVVNQILTDLASYNEVRPEVPALFSKLVTSLKSIDYSTLTTIYSNAKSSNSLKFLIDAMPLVGTSASAGVVKDMFINGDITKTEVDVFFTSLTFFKNPTSHMFTVIAPLLQANPSQSAMLGTSALINEFCKLNTECSSEAGIQQVLRIIENELGSGCRVVNDEEKMKVMVALKALGNAGRFLNANSVLQRCYTEDNDMEVRVAAIEAWRHTPCDYDRSNLLAAFQDDTQDSEIRIAAYLAVMTCPTDTVIATVKDRLTSEAVNQVGSFVWTHLTNLQESAAPGKQWVRELIGEELLQNKFNTQALKFSRNYESSFFTEELNMGAAVESNVIFSSKSFLPRSAMLNFTIDLFGESINLFEVGGRIEGFESYVETFFGPSGYFPQETVAGIVKNLRETKSDSDETKLEDFLDRVTDDPEGSYYLRMFGNELHYNNFHGIGNLFDTSNPVDMIMELLRGGDIDYTKSLQLIDSDYSIPTMSGLPVTLSAKGTATLALKINGNINANSLTNFNIEGHFHPSAAVQMDGVMMVDAHVTRKGLKISSTLHTSTLIDGKVHINGGKLVDVAINTPKDMMEVIDVNTKFFIMEDEDFTEAEPNNHRGTTTCSSGSSGMQLCMEIDYLLPREWYNQRKPYGGRVYFRKTDTQTGYIMKYTKRDNEVSLLMDTPGSQDNHKMSFTIGKTDNSLQFNAETPSLSGSGNVAYVYESNRKSLNIEFDIGHHFTYALNTELVTTYGNEIKIEPSIVFSEGQQEIFKVRGALISVPNQRKHSLEIETDGNYVPRFSFNGAFEQIENLSKIDVAVQSPYLDVYTQGELKYDETSIFWNNDIEYVWRGQSKRFIKYNSVLQKDVSLENTTYSFKFDMSPNDFSNTILFETKTIMSPGGLETEGTLIHGDYIKWDFEEIWSFVRDENQIAWTGHAKITCPHYNFEKTSTNEFRWTHNEIYYSAKQKLDPSPERSKEFTFEVKRNEDREIILRAVYNANPYDLSFETIYTKIAAGHHKVQVNAKHLGSSAIVLEGSLINKCEPEKIDIVTDLSFNYLNKKNFESSLTIFGNIEGAKMDFKSKIDNEEYNLLMEATRASLLVDTNVYNHIVVNAGMTRESHAMKVLAGIEWDKDNDPSKTIMLQANLGIMEAEAEIKFLDQEIFIGGKVSQDGIAVEGRFAPDKIIKINLNYQLSERRSLTIGVETPFPGWQKQDATLSLELSQNMLKAEIGGHWKNSQQIALTINANIQPGLTNNAFHTDILFSSSLNNFERLTFVLDHKMAAMNINTNIEATWDDKKINGVILLAPTDNGIDGSATFTSPFTQEAAIILHHQLAQTQLSSSLEAKYGSHVSTATLNGHFITEPNHDITLNLKLSTSDESQQEIEVNVKYSFNGIELDFVTEGVVGETKVMLSVNGELTVTGSSTSCSGEVRFITPFMRPITATLSHMNSNQEFNSKLVVSSNDSITFQSNGHILSQNDTEFTAAIDTPATKTSFSFSHKIVNNSLSSQVTAIANDENISVSLSGSMDRNLNVADLEGEVSSTFENLDDIKMTLSSLKHENGRQTKIVIGQGIKSFSIVHNLTYTDEFNWINAFDINNNYKLINTQTHTGTQYGHEMEIKWDDKTISVKGNFDMNFSHSTKSLKLHLALQAPCEYLEDIDVSFNMQKLTSEFTFETAFKNKQEHILHLNYLHRCTPENFTSEASLATGFLPTLSYRLVCLPRTTSLVFLYGEAQTSIELGGDSRPGNMGYLEGHLNITSDFLATPIIVDGLFDVISNEKTFTLSVTTDTRYAIIGTLSGEITNPKIFLSLDLPIENLHHIENTVEYQVASFPLTFNTELKVDHQTYKMNGMASPRSFQIEVDGNGQRGSVSSNWELLENKANIELHIQSPFASHMDVGGSIMFDFESAKKFGATMTYNNQELILNGKLEAGTFVFEGKTPFSYWENLSASVSISNSAITAFAARNEEKIEVTGTLHLKSQKGTVELSIKTPFEGHQTIYLEAIYNFNSDSKTVQFKSNYDMAELTIKAAVNFSNLQAPEITLNLDTPFPDVKNLRAVAKWNIMNSVKTAEVVVHHESGVYNWRLEAASSNPLSGHIISKLSTPLSDWTDVSHKAAFDFTGMSYTVSIEYKKGDLVKKLEGQLSLTGNAIQGNITTPFTGWETMTITGEYFLQQNHLTGNLEISKESERYEVKSDILFNTATPKIKVEIKTPFPQYKNMELSFESNIRDMNKNFHIAFIVNDITYSTDIGGKLERQTGNLHAVMKSPITGFTNLEIAFEHDFSGDVKLAKLTVKKEGQTQFFSVTGGVDGNLIALDVRTPYENFEVMEMKADYVTQPGQHKVIATFTRDNNEYRFLTEVILGDNTINIKLLTPIEIIKNVEVHGIYNIQEDRFTGSISFHKNGDIFELKSNYSLNPIKSHLEIEVKTPITGWTKLGLNLNYDLISERKHAQLVMLKNDIINEMAVEASYSPERGSIKLKTPVVGFENIGAEYTLLVDPNNKKLEAFVQTNFNSIEYTLSVFGHYSTNKIVVQLQTPFNGYETISIEGDINIGSRSGKGIVNIGSYTFTINASYAVDNLLLELTTPYTPLRLFLVSFKYSLTPRHIEGTMNVSVNDDSYTVHGGVQISPRSSSLVLMATTAIPEIQNMMFQVKYDLDNTDKLVCVEASAGENEYKFSIGGYIQEKAALFKFDLTTPFSGWTDVKFQTKIDLMNEDKMIDVVLERDGNMKEICIYGKLIGTEMKFDLRTPFSGINQLNVEGTIDRSKRSIEFQMMNDAGSASIAANFHGAKLQLRTPWQLFEEVLWEIKKTAEGRYVGQWRRNDNHLNLLLERQGASRAVSVEINSELNGWEFLNFVGRLDYETYEAYVSGQRNERKVSVKINGKHDPRAASTYTIEILTPYENFQQITGNLRYNIRRRQLKLLVTSEHPEFKIDIQTMRPQGQASILIPHPEKNTVFTLRRSPSEGEIFFDSRFDFLPKFRQGYATTSSPLGVTGFVEIDDTEVFSLQTEVMPEERKLHFEIHTQSLWTNRKTTIHYHIEGYTTNTFMIKQEVNGVIKEFKSEMTGEGDLPTFGTFNIHVTNSFASPARNTRFKVIVDRRSENKNIKIEVTTPNNKLYVIDIRYKINLQDIREGSFAIAITTPERRRRIWQNITGDWDLNNLEQGSLTLTIGGRAFRATGKFGLTNTDITITPPNGDEEMYLKWKFERRGDMRDYFFRFGPNSRKVMFSLNGPYNPSQGNVRLAFRLGRLMEHDFQCTNQWTRSPGQLQASGTFNYGEAQGNHEFTLNRNAAERSAIFNFILTSSDDNYGRTEINGAYDFNNKFKINVLINRNGAISVVDIDISEFSLVHSLNTIKYNIPRLEPYIGDYKSMDLTLQHDFTTYDSRYVHVIANFGNREAYMKANWERSEDLKTLKGTIDIKSRFVGEIHMLGMWDVRLFNNAEASIDYKRTKLDGSEIEGTLRWNRVAEDNRLQNDLVINSNSRVLTHFRSYIDVDFSSGFNLEFKQEINDQIINVNLEVGNNTVSGKIITPFPGFELITGLITYSLEGKNQSVTMKYERGSRKVDISLVINRRNKRRGELEFNLTSPFRDFRNMKITANWNKKQATLEYLRNDVRISMSGTARYEGDKSEFNFTFTAPDGKTYVLGASYDVQGIIAGVGTELEKIASLQLSSDNLNIDITINGYRNDEERSLVIDAESSLLNIDNFHLKLYYEKYRNAVFELIMNDFVLKIDNTLELPENGEYYFRSRIESSLTPLPALVFGLGYKDGERIITMGFGEDRELTFSIKSESNYMNDFSGRVDLPHYGYEGGIKYEAEYNFPNPNRLVVHVELELGESEEEVDVHFQYDSDGVEARLSSPFTGRHNLRARRSITPNGFKTEVKYNDFNLILGGQFDDDDFKRGGVLEGEVFGNKFLIDYLVQTNGLNYNEGKLIIQTPFEGIENMGGLFTISTVGDELKVQGELLMPFSIPRITLEIDCNHGNEGKEGQMTLNVAEAQFILKLNLTGTSLSQGYRTKVEILTPFSPVSHLSLEGTIKMENPRKFECEFTLTEPYTTHRLDLQYEVNEDKVLGSASLRSVSYANFNIIFTLEGLYDMHKKLDLQVNNNKLIAEYSFGESEFIFCVNTLYQNVPRKVSVNAQFPSLQNMSGSMAVVLGEMKHNTNGELYINTDRVKGDLQLESTFIEGNRQLKFDLSIPSQSLNQIILELSLTTSQTHSVHFEFDSRTGILAKVLLNTPAMENVSAIFELSAAAAEINVQTPTETHRAKLSWRMTQRMPADYIGIVELESPILDQKYTLSVLVGCGSMNKNIKAELQIGTIQHLFEANMYVRNNAGGFAFTIETPFKNIEKAILEASLQMNDKIKLHIAATLPENENSFDSEVDVNENTFMAEAKSPYIPTGFAKVEATLTKLQSDTKLNVVLMNAEDTISGNLIYVMDRRNFMFKLEITTPIPEFQSLNCLVKVNSEENTKFILFLDYPITFRVDATFTNVSGLLTSNVTVKTSIENWEYLEANLSMPLDKFAPRATLDIPGHKYGVEAEFKTDGYSKRAMANLFLDDEVHGGKLNIRTKAPYELGYKFDIQNIVRSFHLRTDSSFVSAFM